MSANLDKSLDDIVVGRRQDARRRGSRRNKASTATGGVKKNKATKASAKGAKSAPAPAPPKDSKIMVSGMPADVNEANIKEYFTKSAGPVKKVMLTYNQNGTSQGIASIVFSKPDTAAKAARELNGLLVDGRPMKIEVIVDAARAPGIPEPKPLTERVAGQPKAQPKPATDAKAGRRNRRTARRGKASGRPTKKTAEELDAEMEDYFVTENGAPAEGNAPVNGQAQQQPATNGGGEDLGMGDISVSAAVDSGDVAG